MDTVVEIKLGLNPSMLRKFRCGYYIEPQYYNPNYGTKGRRIVTVDICAIWFDHDDIVSREDINNKKNVGGKQL